MMRKKHQIGTRLLGLFLSLVLILSNFIEVSAALSGNILANPDFTDGNNGLDNWKTYADMGGVADFTKNGSNGMNVAISNVGTEEWAIQLYQDNLFLQGGKCYKVSVDIVSSTTRSVILALQNYNADTYEAFDYGRKTPVLNANERQTITFTTDTLGSDIHTGKLYIGLGNINNASAGNVTVYSVNVVPQDGKVSKYNKLVWSDEFDGNEINRDNWAFDIGNGDNGWGNGEFEYYTDRTENASVSDGILTITARREDYNGYQYTSARLKTQGKHSFLYGRMEARLRMDKADGLWPAFWMLGDSISYEGWPKCGEIDIMECANYWTHTLGTLHWADGGGGHQYNTGYTDSAIGDIDVSQWHTYAVEWDEDAIRFLIDGTQYHRLDISGDLYDEFHRNQFFLLNVAVGGAFPGNYIEDTYPHNMQVDYVRVYEEGDDNSSDNNQETELTPVVIPEPPAAEPESPVAEPEAPGTEVDGNVIKNPLFTEGEKGLDGWDAFVEDPGMAVFSPNSPGVKVDINDVGNVDWQIQLAQNNLSLQAGKKYDVTVDLMSNVTRNIKIALEDFRGDEGTKTIGALTPELTGGVRQTIQFTTETITEDTTFGKLYLGMGKVGGNDGASQIKIYSANIVPQQGEIKVIAIIPLENKITLEEGQSRTIAASVSPNNATNKEFDYSSEDPEIAIVSDDGTITAVNAGSTKIILTARDGSEVRSEVTVNVTKKQEEQAPAGVYDGSNDNIPVIDSNDTQSFDDYKDNTGNTQGTNNDNTPENGNNNHTTFTGDNNANNSDTTTPVTSDNGNNNTTTGTDNNGNNNTTSATGNNSVPIADNNGNNYTTPVDGDHSGNNTTPVTDNQNNNNTSVVGDHNDNNITPATDDYNSNNTSPVADDYSGNNTTPAAGNNGNNNTIPVVDGNSSNNTTPAVGNYSGNNSESVIENNGNNHISPVFNDNSGNNTLPITGNTDSNNTTTIDSNATKSDTVNVNVPITVDNDNGIRSGNGNFTPITDDSSNGNFSSSGNTDINTASGNGNISDNGNNTSGADSNSVLSENSPTQTILVQENTSKPTTGTKFIKGKFKYCVISDNTVELVAAQKKTYTSLTIPDTVTFQNVTFRVTSIGKHAFKGNQKLKKITIGTNISKIGSKAFYGCKKLTKITIKTKKLESIGSKALKGINKNAVIKVPNAKLSAYKRLLKGKGLNKAASIIK